jgi:hypothetical protein
MRREGERKAAVEGEVVGEGEGAVVSTLVISVMVLESGFVVHCAESLLRLHSLQSLLCSIFGNHSLI